MFASNTLINFVQNKRKRLFCCFIDLKRAFDTIWRDGLFHKLYMFDIIANVINEKLDFLCFGGGGGGGGGRVRLGGQGGWM